MSGGILQVYHVADFWGKLAVNTSYILFHYQKLWWMAVLAGGGLDVY